MMKITINNSNKSKIILNKIQLINLKMNHNYINKSLNIKNNKTQNNMMIKKNNSKYKKKMMKNKKYNNTK